MRRFALLALFSFVGCLPEDPTSGGGCGLVLQDPLAEIVVASAQLEDVTLWQAGLLGGRTDGSATLVVEDVDGNVIDFVAVLEGNHMGLVADASINITGDAVYPLLLPAAAVTVRDLLGKYQGPHVGLDLVAGVHYRDLTNLAQVRLNVTTLSFGIGFVPVTWEMVGMQLLNDPAEFVDDPATCFFAPCGPCDDFDGVCDDSCAGDLDCDPVDCTDNGVCEPECVDDDVCPVGRLGDLCTRDSEGSCADGLACIRGSVDDALGTCRASCGSVVEGEPVKVGACAAGDACQVATTAPRGAVEGVVCLPARAGADQRCGAVHDERYGDDACGDGLDCRGAGGGSLDNGSSAFFVEQRCKLVCDEQTPCAAGQCLPVSGERTCGDLVAALPLEHADAVPADFVCNEIEGRRYCDQSMFADVAAEGLSLCLELAGNDGFCFPLCSTPTINGQRGEQLACGAGQRCSTALALAAGVVAGAIDDDGFARSCDPAVCREGEPCASCGEGDATCSTLFGAPRCLAPFGSCIADR